MQNGKIVAAGTPLRLKSKYGRGYRLTLTSPSDPTSTKPPVNSASLESSAAGQIIWHIGDAADLGPVVRWADEMEQRTHLRERRKEDTIDDGTAVEAWEINMPTLEDVLLEKKLF
jgi:ABC-type multidrug transport system ATPase subunit